MKDVFDIWKFLAGLGIFLFGLHYVEQALKNLTGRTFKKMLRQYTNNPLKGILGGIAVTAILQSSSVVTLMVLAFVGAGIIELKNAIGIIFGSNLGTTFTGWIVASLGFKADIVSFSLPLIAIGALIMMLINKVKIFKELGRFILGFGFLFLGIEFMKNSIGDWAHQIDPTWFAGLHPLLLVPVGFVLTAIIQSSSASMVIVLSALHAGIFPIESAAAMIIGNDLGTTVTAMLGAIGGLPSKKRVALSHFLFNLITDSLALIFLNPLLYIIQNWLGVTDPLLLLVAFHSVFNLTGIVIMFPFIGLFSKFLERRFTDESSTVSKHIVHVNTELPEAAITALHREINHLIERTLNLNIQGFHISSGLFRFKEILNNEQKNLFSNDNFPEEYTALKQLEGEMVEYYLSIQQKPLDVSESALLNQYIHAIRNAMISAKNMKNIEHNVHDFRNSSNDSKHALYLYLKGRLNDFYLRLHKVFTSSTEAAFFENLSDLYSENQTIYENFLSEVYRQVNEKALSEMEISTLMHVNREIHDANRSLVLAIKDAKLTPEQAINFNTLKEIR